jgi:hypothetical protein
MWNMIAAYSVIAVVLVGYVASILIRTRKIQRALENAQGEK